MKKAILIIFLSLTAFVCFDALAQNWSFSCSGNNCFKAGVDYAGNTIGKSSGIITGKGIAEAVQDVIIYFLGFLALISVIYIMWAGAQMLLFPSDEESSEKTKKIIISVIVGLFVIFFAWWIVNFIFKILNNKAALSDTWIPRAVAETQIREVDFTTYSNRIQALKTKLSTYSPDITRELSILVDGAFDHLPDRGDMYVNQQYYDKVKAQITNYDLHHDSIDLGTLNNALDKFLQQSKTFTIEGQVSAAPRTGDAPLSVTLEAKGMKDGSGTLIPDTNYIWWVRVPEGSKIIGRGKTINYIFQDEGTYTVNLTVNSASKNSKGFRDVINFEDSVTIEVGQPKVKFVVFFNDQLATDNVKLSSRESEQKVIIDASHTKFSSGYTIKKTEWDFGNGKTDTVDGAPLIKTQDYKEGEYIVKLKLTRNDDEVFTKNIILKVGDPIASIFASKLQPDKGEKVTFQAKKVSQDGVSYAWEIRKIGSNSLLATATGPRMEYAFLDVGRYSVDLISSKRDIRDKESIEILIDSQVPVVRFDAQVESSETPNIYLFDGTASYDPDYPDDQTMKYEWFINDKPVQLIDTNSSNSRGNYIFPEKGTYQIELHVTDKEGKQGIFKKTISIKNLLSIQLNIRPQVVKRGERVLLSATAPNAETFEWNITGKEPVVQETGKLITSFDKSGTYPMTIKVTDTSGETNMLKRKIYVVNGEEPFAIMNVTSKSLLSGYEQNACEGQEALIADRVSPVSFVGDKSVNAGGKTSDLTYFWKIGLNKTSTQKNLSHTFDELGCEKVTLMVSDKKTGVTHTTEEWIKVVNVPPRFSDIEVSVENIDMDPMKVNLRIQGAKDPDGVIRSYTWYYATNPDGDEPLGFRITTKPETSLVLQKLTGRYYFFVIMEDSNGMRVDTRSSSEMRFSTPDLLINQNLAMPVIDFRVNSNEVAYGDEVTFDVTVEDVFKKNIADASEFRWDVDGDGFYDIKTTQPTFKYKYTTPGEYHPKVKVTHRGLSTTKSLNIKVVNRLIPQIDLQIIGEKIIAYNTSTGIFESVAWFADDKKISENKEYLYYDASGGTFPKTLKIQISDGKKTEEKIFNIAKNTQNKAIVEQIKNQLVVLTNSDGTITEASDNIVWTDGTKPLFIYLGESQGDIKYYIIDTDVDIDTDLSGGKDDDADNKGTASYRIGRPFQVPAGTQRVTIMKIRLLGADGEEIGKSRQIRVTRDFIAPIEIVPVVSDDKTPKKYNLTVDDKARLEKLNALVKTIPEAERKLFTKYIDQLGDIWYDRADRAETLLQFSQALQANKNISPDLKERLETAIELVYTQGEQDVEQKILARKIIADFLANSPFKKQIFGDGNKVGALDEIIDNPEYYEKNKSLITKIYDEYVFTDANISEEGKKAIKANLEILIGSAPDPTTKDPTNPDNPPVDNNPATSVNYMEYVDKYGLLAGGILAIIIGLLVVLSLFRGRSRGSDSGIPDFPNGEHNESPAEPQHGPGWLHDDHDTGVHQDDSATTSSDAPDWLKEAGSPFGEEDVLAKESSISDKKSETVVTSTPTTTNKTTSDIPDWLNDSHDEKITTPTQTKETPAPATTSQNDIPDWLHEDNNTPAPTANTNPQNSAEPAPAPETPTPNITKEDLPDWLAGAHEEETKMPEPVATIEQTPETTSVSSPEPTVNEIFTPETNTTGLAPTTATPVSLDHDDIPDWLRGAEEATESTVEAGKSEDKNDNVVISPVDTGLATLNDVPESPLSEKSDDIQTGTIPKTSKGKWKSDTHWKKDKEKAPTTKKTKTMKDKKETKKVATELLGPAEHIIGPTHDTLLSEGQNTSKSE